MAGNKSSIEAGKGHVTLSVDQSALQAGLAAAQKTMQAWGKNIMAVGASITAVGASIVAPMLAGLAIFATWGAEVRTGMRETGLSFQEFEQATNGMRVSAEELTPAVGHMSKVISDAAQGSQEANQHLRDLGLSIGELSGMSQGQRLEAIANGISKIGDASQRIAAQRAIFGRGALGMNLEGGAVGMQARAARSREVFGEQTPADLAAAHEYNKAMAEMNLSVKGLWVAIGKAAAPAMTAFFKLITDGVIWVRKIVDEHRSWFDIAFRVADKVMMLGTVVFGLGLTIQALSYTFVALKYVTGLSVIATWAKVAALAIAKVAVIGYSAVVAACSFVVGLFTGSSWMAVAAVAGLCLGIGAVILIGMMWSDTVEAWGTVWGSTSATIIQAWGGISDAISAGDWMLAVEIAWISIQLIWARGINWIRDAWFSFSYIFMGAWDTILNAYAHGMVSVISFIRGLFLSVVQLIGNMVLSVIGLFVENINRLVDLIPEDIRATVGIERVSFDAEEARERGNARIAAARQDIENGSAAAHAQIDQRAFANERERAAAHAAERERARREEAGLQGELDQQGWAAFLMREHQDWMREQMADVGGREGIRQQGKSAAMGTFFADALRGFGGGSGGDSPVARTNNLLDTIRQQMLEQRRIFDAQLAELRRLKGVQFG